MQDDPSNDNPSNQKQTHTHQTRMFSLQYTIQKNVFLINSVYQTLIDDVLLLDDVPL